MIDWSDGRYENTAEEIAPAAERVVAAAAPQPGERVLDVACGTGNAAVLAARAGATIAGGDIAQRLLDVAAQRLGPDADLRVADAAALPWGDDEFDVVLSVFGVIFAGQPEQSAAELVRVARPGGRILLTSWTAEGTIFRCAVAASAAVREVTGDPEPSPSRWSTTEGLQALFAGSEVRTSEHALAFIASSPQGWLDDQVAHHPLYRSIHATLRDAGRWEATERELLQILADGNEERGAFRTTSRYLLAEISPPS